MIRTIVDPVLVFCMVSLSTIACGQDAMGDSAAGARFVEAGSFGNDPTFQIGLGDLDGDGDLDAVFANMHAKSEVWMNDGNGRFTKSGQLSASESHGVGIGDLDGDGDLDLLLVQADTTMPSSVYFNDGSGRFTHAAVALGDRDQAANFVALFDLEGDGDLDAGVYYSDRYSLLYVNDGTAHLEASGSRIPGLAMWGDVDGDGDVDAVVQRFGGGYMVRMNAGRGLFENRGLVDVPSTIIPGGAALGDIDNDGDLDVIGANVGASSDTPLTVLLNDGAGNFTQVAVGQFASSFGRVALGDLNGDGYLDVFVGCLEEPGPIALNDGTGRFFDSGIRLGNSNSDGASAIGDLDGDGDLDVFLARFGGGGPNTVWLNQGR